MHLDNFSMICIHVCFFCMIDHLLYIFTLYVMSLKNMYDYLHICLIFSNLCLHIFAVFMNQLFISYIKRKIIIKYTCTCMWISSLISSLLVHVWLYMYVCCLSIKNIVMCCTFIVTQFIPSHKRSILWRTCSNCSLYLK